MKIALGVITIILAIAGFFVPVLWIFAIITLFLWIGSRPAGVRADGKRKSGGLLGPLIDSLAVNRKMYKCPYCKALIFKDALKCNHCGELLKKEGKPRTLFDGRGKAGKSSQRTYDVTKEALFEAVSRIAAQRGYSIKHTDPATCTISLNTGMSIKTTRGQNMTVTVIQADDLRSTAIIGGRSASGQLYDWGELSELTNDFFILLDKEVQNSLKRLHQHKAEEKQSDSFDGNKWNALVKYDDDIALAVEKLKPLGQQRIDELAASYLALNDKRYLPNLVQNIIAEARKEDEKRGQQLS